MSVTPLKGVLKIKVKITVLTGLHIGGSKENVEIGGVDNIVEKLKVFRPGYTVNGKSEFLDVPYIPGSSLKGKLRSLVEWVEKDGNGGIIAISNEGKPCSCGTCRVCKLFGVYQARNIVEPVRLRVDDFYPTRETLEMWERILEGGYVEIKTENMINRIRGVAEHPRHTERVIAGSEFEGFLTLRLFEGDGSGEELLKLLKTALEMLEDDYLGGSGSRGYGRVKIKIEDIIYKRVADGRYESVSSSEELSKAREVLGGFMEAST
jgi:CRISPR-associated protein Csm3